jgi:hypothetical protein
MVKTTIDGFKVTIKIGDSGGAPRNKKRPGPFGSEPGLS